MATYLFLIEGLIWPIETSYPDQVTSLGIASDQSIIYPSIIWLPFPIIHYLFVHELGALGTVWHLFQVLSSNMADEYIVAQDFISNFGYF